jgi:catechol 2,3-dioxygenase-like lactoylglutathione lyase family enzyme
MHFVHVGLVSSSEQDADRFFGDLLGLPKTRKSSLSCELVQALFGIDQDCELAYYGDAGLVFEVFLMGWSEPSTRRISHTCIEVADLEDLLRRSRAMGFEVREVQKGGKVIVFLADADGNLFEVKAKAS